MRGGHWWRWGLAFVAAIVVGSICGFLCTSFPSHGGMAAPVEKLLRPVMGGILSGLAAYILPPIVAALLVFACLIQDGSESTLLETRCRRCGYILRGITEPRCPECGEHI
jgi:amino acid transporter